MFMSVCMEHMQKIGRNKTEDDFFSKISDYVIKVDKHMIL